jgi:dUTP pyrophosphatase
MKEHQRVYIYYDYTQGYKEHMNNIEITSYENCQSTTVDSRDFASSEELRVTSNVYNNNKLRYVSNGPPLERSTSTSGGYDLYADSIENREIIGTGIFCEIPPGWVGMVVPRSSLGAKGFKLCNTVGVIDSDYRGEILLKFEGYVPEPGERVAQLVIVPCWHGNAEQMVSINDLSSTARGTGGFGSTGK